MWFSYDCTVIPFRRILWIGKLRIKLWPLYKLTKYDQSFSAERKRIEQEIGINFIKANTKQ